MVLDPLETWSSHPDQLLADLNYFGYLFEALVVRDLRVFADVDVLGRASATRSPITEPECKHQRQHRRERDR